MTGRGEANENGGTKRISDDGKRPDQALLIAHILALAERFDAKAKLKDWFGETTNYTSDLFRGARTFQHRHIAGLIKALRAEAASPSVGPVGRRLQSDASLSWGRADEYELLWLFVFGTPPLDFDEAKDVHFTKGEFRLGGWHQPATVCEFAKEGYDLTLIDASFDGSPLKRPADPGHRAAFDEAERARPTPRSRQARMLGTVRAAR
ncbi:MAG: hypothetical protein KIS68_03690 [Bauldia sp.]|nr:hypothetical protein [Bauldia sp.]